MTRIGVFVLLILSGVWNGERASGQEQPKQKTEAKKADASKTGTHLVKPDLFKIEVNLTGTFEAETDQMAAIALKPETWTSFTVKRAVAHGKVVKRGEPLVWLDTRQIDEQLADLKQSLQLGILAERLAAAELEQTEKSTPLDVAAADRASKTAAEDLEYFLKTDRPHEEQSAEFSLKSSQQSLEYALEELNQLQKMYDADDLTEETEEIILKRAKHDVERSRFYLKSSELRNRRSVEVELPRREKEMRDAAVRSALALAKARIGLPNTLEKKKLEYEKQLVTNKRNEAKYRKLEKDRLMMDVRSPVDGIVYYGQCKRGKWTGLDPNSSSLREGGKLAAHSVFMTILRPGRLHVRLDVPEKDLRNVRRGIKGKALPVGYPDMELPTSVQQVSRFPVGSGIFDGRFEVALGDAARFIMPGMSCKVTLVAYEKKDAIAIPAATVFENPDDGKRNMVYVEVADGKPVRRKVVVGRKTELKWEIVKGLAAGDKVLLKKPDDE